MRQLRSFQPQSQLQLQTARMGINPDFGPQDLMRDAHCAGRMVISLGDRQPLAVGRPPILNNLNHHHP